MTHKTRVQRVLGDAWPGTLRNLLANRDWWVCVALVAAITVLYYGFVDRRGPLAGLFFFEIKHDLIGVLYLIPFIYAAVLLGLAGGIASWILCFVAVMPRMMRYSVGVGAQLSSTLFFMVPLLLAMTVLLELRWRTRHAQMAAEREQERRMQIDRVFQAQEEERYRIAQGLHDDVLQRLLAIAYTAEHMMEDHESIDSDVRGWATEIRQESVRLAEDLRRLSYDLRPSMLDSLGIVSAIGWLCNRLRQESGINARLLASKCPERFSANIETTVFRIVQEALNNAMKHSLASDVVVILRCSPHRLRVEVADDGVGFSVGTATQQAVERGHLGLLGMRQRAESLGGSLTIKSRPDAGTTILATIPLSAISEGDSHQKERVLFPGAGSATQQKAKSAKTQRG